MFNLGFKHRIDNLGDALTLLDSAGAVTTDPALVAKVVIAGTGTFPVASILNPSLARATAGSVFTDVITFAGSNLAALTDITLQLETISDRNEAIYSRNAYTNGNINAVSVRLAAGSTPTQIAAAVAAQLQKRIASYNDLPFTVGASGAAVTLTGLAGKEHVRVKLAYEALRVRDVQTGTVLVNAITVSEVLTEGKVPLNSGKFLEENISMHTLEAGRLGAAHSDELVSRSAKYASIYFQASFTSEDVASPGFVGQASESGVVNIGLYLNESAFPAALTDAYTVFVAVLAGKAGAVITEEDGSLVEGVTALDKADDFFGLGLSGAGVGDLADEA